jgi:hypothetical protein
MSLLGQNRREMLLPLPVHAPLLSLLLSLLLLLLLLLPLLLLLLLAPLLLLLPLLKSLLLLLSVRRRFRNYLLVNMPLMVIMNILLNNSVIDWNSSDDKRKTRRLGDLWRLSANARHRTS